MSILKAVLTAFFIFVFLVNSASATIVLTVKQGEELTRSLGFTNNDAYDSVFAWADASGNAASWVRPGRIDFGVIDPQKRSVKDYTIKVPENQYPGYYNLIWTRRCEYVSGRTCAIDGGGVEDIGLIVENVKPTSSYVNANPTSTAKFRVGPIVRLRPVTDVIDAEQDGIVELYMDNPSLNEVALTVFLGVDLPSGIYLYGEGLVPLKNEVYTNAYGIIIQPGTSKTIAIIVKADKSAEVGQHDLQINGLYMPGDNVDSSQEVALLYSVNVKEASAEPYSPEPSVTPITDTSPVSISEIIFIIIFILLIFFVIKITTKRGKKPTPAIKPTPTRPTPAPYSPTPQKPEPEEAISKPSASVELHGEKTDVVLGEDIILKLSAVNLITKPVMTVQVILIPPSGMSVTSSEFVISGAGQYTTTYTLNPGSGKDIEV